MACAMYIQGWKRVLLLCAAPIALVSCSTRYDVNNGAQTHQDGARKLDYRVIPVSAPLVAQLQQEQERDSARRHADVSPAKHEEKSYRLGSRDTVLLRISVIGSGGNLELAYPPADGKDDWRGLVVGDSGMLDLPMAGKTPVAGKTLEEAEGMIREALISKNIYTDPHVALEVLKFESQRVSVTGEVGKPGEIVLNTTPLTVLKAIESAGGLKETADLERATLRRKDGEVIAIDLVALTQEGNPRQNYQLEAGDVLSVGDTKSGGVFLMGELNDVGALASSRAMPLRYGKASLIEALTSLKTIDRVYGSYEHVYVIRNAVTPMSIAKAQADPDSKAPVQLADASQVQVYALDASAPHAWALAEQFPLKSRDVVYVAPRPLADWSRFMTLLLPQGLSTVVGRARDYGNWAE